MRDVRKQAETVRDLAAWLFDEVSCGGDPEEMAAMADQLSSDADRLHDLLEDAAERQADE